MRGNFLVQDTGKFLSQKIISGRVVAGRLIPGMETISANNVLRLAALYADQALTRELTEARLGQKVSLLMTSASDTPVQFLPAEVIEFTDMQSAPLGKMMFKPSTVS